MRCARLGGWVTTCLALAACGQTSTHTPDASTTGGNGASSDSTSAAGAAPNEAGSPSTLGGSPPIVVEPDPPEAEAGAPTLTAHPAAPCDDRMVLPYGGGYESCADGSLRRPRLAACISQLPRAEAASGRVYEECEYDADCNERENGYCVIGACYYGCLTDVECGPGEVCLCGEWIGKCQAAACASDADCPADYPCTGNPTGTAADFRCQTPFDDCQTDAECNQFDALAHCETEGSRRTCVHRRVE